MPSFDDAMDGFSPPADEAAMEDASISSRLRAEEFRAEDLDGLLEGVSGSGNLNFAVLQAGLADGGALASDGAYGALAGADIGSAGALAFGRQAIGDAAQSYGAALPGAPSFGGAQTFSGNGPLYIDDLAGPKLLQNSSGAANGSSFSAQFSVAPIGAAINDGAAPDAPPVVSGPTIRPGGADAPTTNPPDGPGGPSGPGDPGDPGTPGDPGADKPGIDDVLDIVTDAVVPLVDPVLDLINNVAETLDGVIQTLPLDPVVELLGDTLDGVGEVLDPVTDLVDGLQDALLGGAEEIANGLLTGVADLGDALLGDTLLGDVTGALPGLANLLDLPPLGGVADDALSGAVDLVDTLTTGGLGDTVGGLTGAVSDLIDGGLGDFLDGALKDPASLADGLGGLVDSITAPIGGLPGDAILDHVLTVVDNVIDQALGGEHGDLVGDVTNSVNDLVGGVGTDVFGEGPLGDVVDGATDLSGDLGGALDDVVTDLADPLSDIADGVEDVLDGPGGLIEEVTEGVGDVVEDVVDEIGGAVEDLLGGDDGLLGGDDPLIEIDSALSLNSDGATGDTTEDGEGSLLDIDIVAPLDSETLLDGDGVGDILDGVETEVTIGDEVTVDPVDLADGAIDGVDEILDGAEELLDVDSLLSPLEDTIDGVVDLLDRQEGEADLSLDVSDTGDIGGDLIGDIIINDGDGLISDLGGGLDLPDPDAILSEGLPLVDEGLGGLVGGGGLFG